MLNSLINIPSSTWQDQLKNTINNLEALCIELDLDYNLLAQQTKLNFNPKFPLRVPRYFLNKIEKNNYQDPLLLQILPLSQELINTPGFCHDPLQEQKYTKAPGLIHKYHNRVLLTLTSACGIHCRYCFRQYFPYAENILSTKQRQIQLDYINNNPHINEIILSGGDPLCVNNNYLDILLSELNNIKHLTTIRFHSRLPIVIPDRIDNKFIHILNKYTNLKFILVTHCNHPNELDNHIKNKIYLLKQNNITVLNQSVLLKNINDNPNVLINLSNKLFDCYIMPYYLHLLDPVTGVGHFDVDLNSAKNLMSAISSKLSGYLVPKLVQEVAGTPNKTVIL